MPSATAHFARHSSMRLARYLKALLVANPTSKSKLAEIAGVPASRVSQWIIGSRRVTAETAFDLGEKLQRELGWETSGPEFLWACGYWADLLELILCLVVGDGIEDPEPLESHELGVLLYSWLPQRMLEFEQHMIADRFREKYGLSGNDDQWRLASLSALPNSELIPELERIRFGESWEADLATISTVLSNDPGAREILRYARDHAEQRAEEGADRYDTITVAGAIIRSKEFTSRLSDSWERAHNREVALARHDFALHFGTSARIADVEIDLVLTIVESARRLNEVMFPTYAVPRVWRMAAGWISELWDFKEPMLTDWSIALPDNFVPSPTVDIRNDRELEIISKSLVGDSDYLEIED